MSTPRPSVAAIFLAALRLGCTSFGGPVAHLGYFRHDYVGRRRWLDEQHYADLVALCQFLPGPASSQLGFGIGLLQRGLAGGVAAWLGFTLPSTVLMITFGYGMRWLGATGSATWWHGLKIAAAAVVAQAVVAMWRTLCPDLPRSALALATAAAVPFTQGIGGPPWLIAGGMLAGCVLFRSAVPAPALSPPPVAPPTVPRSQGVLALAIFAGLLFGLPVLARLTHSPSVGFAEQFYRTGALVFGGGHVLLPLLEQGVVAPGWIGHDQFLTGYGAAQALPGPLFAFTAYLGTVAGIGPGGWPGGLWALGWSFAPGLLLVLGVWPWWQSLRARPATLAALRGANAVVVGLLLAALISPVGTTALTSWRAAGLAVAAFGALHVPRVSPWVVVLASALIGAFLL